jgi:DnaT-like ssDNA binding protein
VSLTVETGAGVQDADSYVTTTQIDTYWGNRTHMAFYTAWNAADTATKDGAAREATQFLDAVWGRYYRGVRKGYVQGLLWPRTGALDEAGFLLPDLPPEITIAACELAGRAVTARLASDETLSGTIKRKREKVDVIEEETEFAGAADVHARYGFVGEMLAPVLNGSQPGSGPQWGFR